MNYNEMMEQLQDLLEDKEKYVDNDDPDDIIKKDVESLKTAIETLNNANRIMEYQTTELRNLHDEIDFYKEIIKKLIKE